MSFAIVDRTVDAEGDKRIVLRNGQISRQINLGTWTRMRVGMRMAIQGTTVPSPFNLFIGLSSGTSQTWSSVVATHVVGAWWSGGTQSYAAGPPDHFLSGNQVFFYKKVSQTKTLLNATTIGQATNNMIAASATTRNCIYFLEFRKVSSTSMGLTMINPGNTLANVGNRTSDIFRNAIIANTAAQAASAATLTANTERTGAVDEGVDGTLNAFNLFWGHPTIGLEVGSVTFSKLE